MNRFLALLYGAGALFLGYQTVFLAFKVKDVGGWIMVLVFAGVAAFFVRSAWKDWGTPDSHVANPTRRAGSSPAPAPPARPGVDPVPLEDQIAALADAGLVLAPGRTMDELLISWGPDYYASDPYGLLLFMYGSEVEAEPRGRVFCERGWDFDMECLEQAGDYARALREIVRITGRPGLVTDLSDDFNIDAGTARIKYTVNGRARVLKAVVADDWADPEAVTAFVKDVEAAVGDDRRFWASDNGQSSTLFFISEGEAAKINALSPGILERYAAA